MRNHHRSGRTGVAGIAGATGVITGLAGVWLAMAAAATLALSSPVAATTTWRCGNAYADTPCPGGRRIDSGGASSDAARRAADEATRRIESRADAMERERLRAEQTTAARNGPVILADHRVAEAQAREAARRTAERAARDESSRTGRSGKPHGRKQAAIHDVTARADGGKRR